MSILSTVFGLAKSAGSAIIPGIGPALKFGPYIAIVLLGGFAFIQHSEIVTARANTATAQADTQVAVNKCQTEASTEAAAESAASVAQIKAAQAIAGAATAQLMQARQAADAAQSAAAAALIARDSQIDTQAALPGQDGAIPPILAEIFP